MSVSAGQTTTSRPVAAGPARTALATVCISGTLEDKLAAAAAAGFDGVEIFEPDLVASPLAPAQLRVPVRRAGPVDRPLPALPRLRRGRPRPAGGEPAPGGTQVRHHERAGHRPDPGLLLGLPRRPRRRRRHRRTAAHAGLTGGRAGPAGLLRGAGLGSLRQHLRAVLGDRAPGRPPGAGPVRGQLPHPVPRLRPGRDPRHPGREAVLPAARRRPAHGHGRAAVEPAPPAVPRSGSVGPAGVPGPRAHRRLPRAAVARGVQRRVPPVRPAPVRGRRAALVAGAAGGDPPAAGRADPGAGGGDRAAAHPAAGRVRVHRTGHGRRRRRGAGAGRARLRAHRAAPVQAGAAVAAGHRPGAAQRVRPDRVGTDRIHRRRGGRAGRRDRRPGRGRRAGRGAARPGAAAQPGTGGGGHLGGGRAGRDRDVLPAHRRRRAGGLAGRLRARPARTRPPAARPGSPGSTTSR